MAEALAQAGARVMIGDLQDATEVAERIGGEATHLDVTDHYATPAGNGLAFLALLAAVAMTLRVILLLAITLRRASRER